MVSTQQGQSTLTCEGTQHSPQLLYGDKHDCLRLTGFMTVETEPCIHWREVLFKPHFA